jgi:hypothetical protein
MQAPDVEEKNTPFPQLSTLALLSGVSLHRKGLITISIPVNIT